MDPGALEEGEVGGRVQDLMSSCEKCWSDAQFTSSYTRQYSVAEEYQRLMAERADHSCTPEEQAGPEAKKCPTCGRMVLHQHTGECMAGCLLIYEDEELLAIVACIKCGARFDIAEQICPRCQAINCEAYKPSHHGKDQPACKSGCPHREACPW